MPTIRIDQRDLLRYDAVYRIIICQECQFAIQKSALESHLLRHKIYRDERRRILSSCKAHDICEPNEVQTPPSGAPPVSGILIQPGYCCTVHQCGVLYASVKRMQMHQREVHGLQVPAATAAHTRTARLQTFFRGTKLRYFEVLGHDHAIDVPTNLGGHSDAAVTAVSTGIARKDVAPSFHPTILPSKASQGASLPQGSHASVSLETTSHSSLHYFHHFITVVSLSLPPPIGWSGTLPYWQDGFVKIAYQRSALMFDLMTLSICHLGASEQDAAKLQMLRRHAWQHWMERRGSDSELEKHVQDIQGYAGLEGIDYLAATHLELMLYCALYTIMLDASSGEPMPGIQGLPGLITVLEALQKCPVESAGNTGDEAAAFYQQRLSPTAAVALLRVTGATDINAGTASTSSSLPSEGCIQSLPYRMAAVFGRPDDERDAVVCIAAIARLLRPKPDKPSMHEAWYQMASWCKDVPGHFYDLVARNDPAALVVLAYWAGSLVRHAELSGCWWVQSMEKRLMWDIKERLPANVRPIQGLLEPLTLSQHEN